MTIGTLTLWSCFSQENQKSAKIRHVVISGFDGLSPDGIEHAISPNFQKIK